MWFRDLLKEFFSIVRALVRLFLVTLVFIFDGINSVVFSRREICDYDYLYTYQNVDLDKISYMDRLKSQVDGDAEIEEGYTEEGFDEDEQS